MFKIYKVQGSSMDPTLREGDYVATRSFLLNLKRGDIIVLIHPFYDLIIKRVTDIHPINGIRIAGDNPQSTSEEKLGWVPFDAILCKVMFSIQKPKSTTSDA